MKGLVNKLHKTYLTITKARAAQTNIFEREKVRWYHPDRDEIYKEVKELKVAVDAMGVKIPPTPKPKPGTKKDTILSDVRHGILEKPAQNPYFFIHKKER